MVQTKNEGQAGGKVGGKSHIAQLVSEIADTSEDNRDDLQL